MGLLETGSPPGLKSKWVGETGLLVGDGIGGNSGDTLWLGLTIKDDGSRKVSKSFLLVCWGGVGYRGRGTEAE